MKVDSWKCDNCTTQKKDANRWWKAWRFAQGGSVIVPWDLEVETITHGSTEYKLTNEPFHLCGESCVVQWLSKNVLGAEGSQA